MVLIATATLSIMVVTVYHSYKHCLLKLFKSVRIISKLLLSIEECSQNMASEQ